MPPTSKTLGWPRVSGFSPNQQQSQRQLPPVQQQQQQPQYSILSNNQPVSANNQQPSTSEESSEGTSDEESTSDDLKEKTKPEPKPPGPAGLLPMPKNKDFPTNDCYRTINVDQWRIRTGKFSIPWTRVINVFRYGSGQLVIHADRHGSCYPYYFLLTDQTCEDFFIYAQRLGQLTFCSESFYLPQV